MRDEGAVATSSTTSDQNGRLNLLELCLRFSVLPLAVASLWLTATDRQVADGYGKLGYNDFSGLKFLLSVDAIAAAYAFASIVLSRLKSFTADWSLYFSDQAVAYLLLTSGSAAAEILYLAYKGDRETTWSEACSYYGAFCRRAKLSLVLHFVALLCFVALAVVSAFRVFSKFEAPCVSSPSTMEDGEQTK